jgi:non-heme chloroperoxidase
MNDKRNSGAGVMRTHHIEGAGGVDIRVDETGEPSGRPVLFIHGISQCRLAWRRQLASGLGRELRLVAMDLRGHGGSGRPGDGYGDSAVWAGDVHQVITALHLDEPILCGWSYGGVVVCDYLRRYGEDRIGGINLVSAISKLGTEQAFDVIQLAFLALAPGLFSTDADQSVEALAAMIRMVPHQPPEPHDFYTMLGYNVSVPPHVREALFSRTVDNDDLLRTLRTPVLVTHGEEDALVRVAAAEAHAAAIPRARLSLYPGVGHAPFWEDAARFNRELREFVVSSHGTAGSDRQTS